MARNYKRDAKGRFARINSSRKRRKANRIEKKYNRIDSYFKSGEMNSIKGSPLERKLISRQARRKAQIARLRG